MKKLAPLDLVKFLSGKSKFSGFIQRLKISYRPLICPFVDLISHVQSTDQVFDIGCGAGQFCLLLAEFTPVKKIKGIEIKGDLIREAKNLLEPYQSIVKSEFETFDGKNLPEDVSNYSLIYMIDVYHHIPIEIRKQFLTSLFVKMKPQAKLILKDIERASPLVYMNKLHDYIFSGEIGNEVSSNEMVLTLKEIGFKINTIEHKRMWCYPHYTILAEK